MLRTKLLELIRNYISQELHASEVTFILDSGFNTLVAVAG